MRTSYRIPRFPAPSLCLVLLPALLSLSACSDSGGSPTAPGTATLSGTVIEGTSPSAVGTARTLRMGVGMAGVTVRVTGTSKSTVTDATGNFTLSGVPTGSVDLELERADVHARAHVFLSTGMAHDVTIAISGSTGVVVPGGHSGEEIEGLVSALDAGAGTLTVLDQRLGAAVVQTDETTVVRNGSTTIPLSQIQVGNRVHVKALVQEDGSYLATEVLLQGDRVGGNREVSGSVVSINADDGSFVVLAGVGNVTVQTDASTTFRRRGGTAAFSDLAAGAGVDVNGTLRADGSVLARRVTIER